MESIYSVLPKVDNVLDHHSVASFEAAHIAKTEAIRTELAALRAELPGREGITKESALEEVCAKVLSRLTKSRQPHYKRVINATGIVLHTNLGRAVLSSRAKKYIDEAIAGYTNLEFDLDTGLRGNRYGRILESICAITGAQAAIVVNNNAAAVLLALHTLCRNKEAIISKGELVEIGDSFRVPELMACCGTVLREVGTTNKTNLNDYESAIGESTGVIQKVHTSNFVIRGYHKSVSLAELATLGKKYGLPVISDLGSGSFIKEIGGDETTPSDEIVAGADVVTFSGDKLLGGPQCGIIAGKAEYVSAIRKNPLMRALRADKITLAALDGTLVEYLDGENAVKNVPVLGMLTASRETLLEKAESLSLKIKRAGADNVQIESIKASVGGGSMPGTELDSFSVCFNKKGVPVEEIASRLRQNDPPIICFIRNDLLNLDARTMTDSEIDETAAAVERILQR